MYSIAEHKHRFSAWAASRAASVIGCRFSVEEGKEILEVIKNIPLPNNQMEFNIFHLEQRVSIISKAKLLKLNFSHGVAAKLLNCYYKSMYVNDESIDIGIRNIIHPPIDSLLLESLYKNNVGGVKNKWKKAKDIRWSKFSSDDYQDVIDEIIKIYKYEGLWMVEMYWSGFQ